MNYNYYIAMDYSQQKTSIALGKSNPKYDRVFDVESNIKTLKTVISRLSGTKILTIEESTASQWLWVELRMYVDEIIICDPYYNFLLSSGPKNDRIDALKLLNLLRGNLLKPVFHSAEIFMEYRKLMSTYDDIVKTGVRWKNRRCAILRAQGKSKRAKALDSEMDSFTLAAANDCVAHYESLKKCCKVLFRECIRKSRTLQALESIPGIAEVGAMKIAAIVVDPSRFADKGRFWAYCGLVRHNKFSGGRSYGSRNPRCCRQLKSVFKTAVIAVIQKNSKSEYHDYYRYLLKNGVPDHDARNKVARKIAALVLSIMASGEFYRKVRIGECKTDSGN